MAWMDIGMCYENELKVIGKTIMNVGSRKVVEELGGFLKERKNGMIRE